MPSSGSCGASTRGVIFNFGYIGTNKKRSADPDLSCRKYPIPDDTPSPFGHRKITPDHARALGGLVPHQSGLARAVPHLKPRAYRSADSLPRLTARPGRRSVVRAMSRVEWSQSTIL